MLKRFKMDLRTIVIAVVAAAVTAGGPAIAHGVHAAFAHNADKVDGKHAVGSGSSLGNAGGKLVATQGSGKFAPKFIPTLKSFQAVKSSNESLAGSTSSGTANTVLTLPNLPAGTYAVSATVGGNAQSTDTSRLVCDLALGSGSARSIGRIGDDLSYVAQDTWPLALNVKISGSGTATVACWTEGLTGSAPFIGASATRIVAVRLG
jgi:hypothetical protein